MLRSRFDVFEHLFEYMCAVELMSMLSTCCAVELMSICCRFPSSTMCLYTTRENVLTADLCTSLYTFILGTSNGELDLKETGAKTKTYY